MTVRELSKQAVAHALEHMNADHGHNLLDMAHNLVGYKWATAATMTTLDPCGFDLLIQGGEQNELKRVNFPKPVTDTAGLRQALVVMAQQANPKLIENRENNMEEQTEQTFSANATVGTAKASRYMKALCNHFDRKAQASYNDVKGDVVFEFGNCQMKATAETLEIHVSAPTADLLERTKYVVGDHLVRFGQKDELQVEWLAG